MRKYGCIKDRPDKRDYLMRAYLPVGKIPLKVDYTKKMSPVRDQGEEGTCVGFAGAVGMKEYQEKIDYGKLVKLSPRFLYEETRKVDGIYEAEGITIRSALKILANKGVCQEKYWPYKSKKITGAVKDAKKFKVKTYARILNLNELRRSIAKKGPCIIGIAVFEGMQETITGRVPMPKQSSVYYGGHAICPIGYDDKKKLIKFKNSWGLKWGEKGYGYLPYTYIENFMLDAWSSIDINDPNPLTIESIKS